jgi:transposase-like protein
MMFRIIISKVQSTKANFYNSYASRTVRAEGDKGNLNAPCDRDSRFESQLVKKNQTRFTLMDDKFYTCAHKS